MVHSSYMKKITKPVNFGFHALVWREKTWFVARAVEVEVASQGKTAKEALTNLQEALELFFEDEKIPSSSVVGLPDLQLETLPPPVQYA